MNNGKHRFDAKDWTIGLLIGSIVFAAFLAPAYVVKESHDQTEILLERFDTNAQERLDQAINVNVLTILCVLAIPIEERNSDNMRECIIEGFRSSPDVTPPNVPNVPTTTTTEGG